MKLNLLVELAHTCKECEMDLDVKHFTNKHYNNQIEVRLCENCVKRIYVSGYKNGMEDSKKGIKQNDH